MVIENVHRCLTLVYCTNMGFETMTINHCSTFSSSLNHSKVKKCTMDVWVREYLQCLCKHATQCLANVEFSKSNEF